MSAADFAELSPTTLADCLPRSQIMDFAGAGGQWRSYQNAPKICE
jgi:hypothetical protein